MQREPVIHKAERYIAAGRYTEALLLYERLSQDDPSNVRCWHRRGDLLLLLGRLDEGIRLFAHLANLYASEGFLAKAIAVYRRLLRLAPTRLDLHRALAELYVMGGMQRDGLEELQLIANHLEACESAAAIEIYQRMIELEPEQASYRIRLARLCWSHKLYARAIEAAREGAELLPRGSSQLGLPFVYLQMAELAASDLEGIGELAQRLCDAGEDQGALEVLATFGVPSAGAVAHPEGWDEVLSEVHRGEELWDLTPIEFELHEETSAAVGRGEISGVPGPHRDLTPLADGSEGRLLRFRNEARWPVPGGSGVADVEAGERPAVRTG